MSVSSSTAAGFNFDGVISGLKTGDIITKLMQLEQAPIIQLQKQQARIQARDKAYQDIAAKGTSLQSAAAALLLQSAVLGKTASSSAPTFATATAGADAVNGSFSVNVLPGNTHLRLVLENDSWSPPATLAGSEWFLDTNQTLGVGVLQLLARQALITGSVLNESGIGVANIRVRAWRLDDSELAETVSGVGGAYSLAVISGTWEIRAVPPLTSNIGTNREGEREPCKVIKDGGQHRSRWDSWSRLYCHHPARPASLRSSSSSRDLSSEASTGGTPVRTSGSSAPPIWRSILAIRSTR